MQIVLNRIHVRSATAIRAIASVAGKPAVLTYCSGFLFKAVTPLDIVLKDPPAKINSKL